MKEKIILFFLFISFNVHSAQEAYNSNHQNESMCNSTHIDKYLGAQKAISLNITVEKSRKWGKNYIQAVTDTSSNINIPHIILEKYKKNFNADIEVSFNNGLICYFPAKIRNAVLKGHFSAKIKKFTGWIIFLQNFFLVYVLCIHYTV